MITISNKRNFKVIKGIIPKRIIQEFQKEFEKNVNKLIYKNKLKIEKNLSINTKLLAIEEINHNFISKIYNNIKKFKTIKKLEKNLKIQPTFNFFFKKKTQNHSVGVRLDLSNNLNWNLKWHQENSYVGDKNRFIFFWFPLLNKNDSQTGGLEIYEKFTSVGYNYKNVIKKDSKTQKIPTNFKLKSKFFKEVRLNLGDILIFDKYLFHRSVTNTSHKAKVSCVMSFSQTQ